MHNFDHLISNSNTSPPNTLGRTLSKICISAQKCFIGEKINPLQPATRKQIARKFSLVNSYLSHRKDIKSVVLDKKDFFVIEWLHVAKWQHPGVRGQKI